MRIWHTQHLVTFWQNYACVLLYWAATKRASCALYKWLSISSTLCLVRCENSMFVINPYYIVSWVNEVHNSQQHENSMHAHTTLSYTFLLMYFCIEPLLREQVVHCVLHYINHLHFKRGCDCSFHIYLYTSFASPC